MTDSAEDAPLDSSILREAIEGSGDAVIVVDAGGVIRYWNSGASRVFGYAPEEALGHNLDIIIPERLRARHWEGFTTALSTGVSRYGPGDLLAVPAVTSEGRKISVEFTATLVTHEGAVTHVAAILRDVTARREQERISRDRLSDLESGASAP